jgi:large subunit ribosomal protein L4
MKKGKQETEVALARTISASEFGLEAAPQNEVAFATCVRVLRQNWRQGTVGCKTRGEVAFSNRKPWRQKGTGRARVSSLRSPLWRKGGIIFGPQPRTRVLKVNKKVQRNVMRDIFAQYVEQGRVFELNFNVAPEAQPKTAVAAKALAQAGLQGRTITLFVPVSEAAIHASFANIPNVRMMLFDQANAYDAADASCWVYLTQHADSFKAMVAQWT